MRGGMKIRKAFCLFEQSGTFRDAFRELGIEAEDYDIQDDFGVTDHRIDLFEEIDRAYRGEQSLFDEIGDQDIVLAFFPCTRFEAQIQLAFRGEQRQCRGYSDLQKLEQSMRLHEELHRHYLLISRLFVIALRGGWRMIVENPVTPPHYLTAYFPVRPALTDRDRTLNGDYYRKPTQYWFVNCRPEQNMFLEPLEAVETKRIKKVNGANRQQIRSLIHPQYARRFILAHIVDQQ